MTIALLLAQALGWWRGLPQAARSVLAGVALAVVAIGAVYAYGSWRADKAVTADRADAAARTEDINREIRDAVRKNGETGVDDAIDAATRGVLFLARPDPCGAGPAGADADSGLDAGGFGDWRSSHDARPMSATQGGGGVPGTVPGLAGGPREHARGGGGGSWTLIAISAAAIGYLLGAFTAFGWTAWRS